MCDGQLPVHDPALRSCQPSPGSDHGPNDRVDQLLPAGGRLAHDPPGGIPEGWRFLDLSVYAIYDPEEGEWWNAAAEYVRTDRLTGTHRLIGGGPSVPAALHALPERLEEPLADRLDQTKGGWDTNWESGHIHEHP